MIKNFIKFAFIFLVFVLLFPVFTKSTWAVYPSFSGTVRNAVTNAPIAGVWVKNTNSGCAWCGSGGGTCTPQPPASEYARTDANGIFYFNPVDGDQWNNPNAGVMIDTDLDGSTDSQWVPNLPPGQYMCTNTPPGFAPAQIFYTYDFGCAADPMSFTVVLPSGWPGYFDTISGLMIDNIAFDYNIGTLYYHPAISTNTPTPGPTNTPTPTPRPTNTPTPTPRPTNTPTPGPTSTSTPTSSPTPVLIPSCTISFNQPSINVAAGGSLNATANVTNILNGTVSQVDFSSLNTFFATVNPPSDTTSAYMTLVSGVNPGITTVTARAIMSGAVRCSTTLTVNVTAPTPTPTVTATPTPTVTPSPSPSPTPSPACIVGSILPTDGNNTLLIGATKQYTAIINTITPANSVDSMILIPTVAGLVTVSPVSANIFPPPDRYNFNYTFDVTAGLVAGNTDLKLEVYSGATKVCDTDSSSATPGQVNIVSALPWWQAKGGDVIAFGDIYSMLPTSCSLNPTCRLINQDSMGFPGLLIYGGDLNQPDPSVNPSLVSQDPPAGWIANTLYGGGGNLENYAMFESRLTGSIPVTAIAGPNLYESNLNAAITPYKGYVTFKYNGGAGDLHIADDPAGDGIVNIGDRRIVVFVESGDVYIDNDITFNKGKGLFVLIAKNNILVDSTVGGPQEATPLPDLQGIYFAEGQFRTGIGDTQLHIRGSVVGLGQTGGLPDDGVLMERDLLNNNQNYPSVLFDYAPEMLLIFPPYLSGKTTRWVETNP